MKYLLMIEMEEYPLKKILLTLGTLLMGLVLLGGCKQQEEKKVEKQADLSGTYFYVQIYGIDESHNDNVIHSLVLTRTDQSNKSYSAVENGRHGLGANQGTVTVDGDIINIKMDRDSSDLNLEEETGMGYNIQDVKGGTFTFKKGVITISDDLKLYKDSTEKGEKYQTIFGGGKNWQQVFHTPDDEQSTAESSDTSMTTESSTISEENSLVTSQMKDGDFSAYDGTWLAEGEQNSFAMTISAGEITFTRFGDAVWTTDGLNYTSTRNGNGTISVVAGTGGTIAELNSGETIKDGDFTIEFNDSNDDFSTTDQSIRLLFYKAGTELLDSDSTKDRFVFQGSKDGSSLFRANEDIMYKK